MKVETVEQAADKDYSKQNNYDKAYDRKAGFIAGAKWQAERSYSEEEVIVLLQKYRFDISAGTTPLLGHTTPDWFEQFKK